MHALRYVSTNLQGCMKNGQVRWCTLNALEIRFQCVANTLQYVGIRCHMTKMPQNLVLFYTLDIS